MTPNIDTLGVRADARRIGTKRYFTGRPCKHGHVDFRLTIDASCCACRVHMQSARRPQNAKYMRERRAQMLANDREGTLKAWRDSNRDLRQKHPESYRLRERLRGPSRRQKERLSRNADTRARQCAQKSRTPSWANLQEIKAFYEACPPGYEVDHIIPLQGKHVSGLHVLENLQYLTSSENRAKGNKFDV